MYWQASRFGTCTGNAPIRHRHAGCVGTCNILLTLAISLPIMHQHVGRISETSDCLQPNIANNDRCYKNEFHKFANRIIKLFYRHSSFLTTYVIEKL